MLTKAVIFKNNAPRYLILEFPQENQFETASKEEVLASSSKLMDKYDNDFKELAK